MRTCSAARPNSHMPMHAPTVMSGVRGTAVRSARMAATQSATPWSLNGFGSPSVRPL